MSDVVDALNDLLGWMATSGWTQGHRSGHEHQTRTNLVTLVEYTSCRCGQPWPCPYIKAWRIATGNPDAGERTH